MNYYALFHGYIVTANADGTIPLNSKIVTKLSDATRDTDHDLVLELIAQANLAAKGESK